jgi:hypothetical protein
MDEFLHYFLYYTELKNRILVDVSEILFELNYEITK